MGTSVTWKRKSLHFPIILFLFILTASAGQAENTPHYRIWQGFKLPELGPDQFRNILADEFLPATVRSSTGKAIVRDAGRLMDSLMWGKVTPYAGTLQQGKAYLIFSNHGYVQ